MKSICFFALLLWLCNIAPAYSQSGLDSISPPSTSKIKWMERQGFPVTHYQWNEPEVNLRLQKALKYRSRSQLYVISGSGLVLSGVALTTAGFFGFMFELLFAPVFASSGDYKSNFSRYGTIMIIGGISAGTGITLTLTGGQSNWRKAQREMRQARRKYDSSQRP
ncbi:hypothetical protein [Tunicatimonas pelagia]|uniref:hypothetical protein n=1 Tax=Tunicatimonas pelagia TaxID=931531 RepID=UPI0026661152|nr:hypothetical protein [Tunicatimonas pelagia]WKN43454.1 hypothetical protein P0M28_00525 [Tunicatimonas pelagia]